MKKAMAPAPPELTGPPAERLAELGRELAAAAARGGHAPPTVVAVAKTFPADAVRPFLAAGHKVFGENRVQEAEAKWPALRAEWPDTELHLVGQLQSNKAAAAVALFDAIHSLDRPSLVVALARACARAGRQPALFVQVNIGDEPQKGGVAIAGLAGLLAEARAAGLRVEGLMGVPPAEREPSPYFALLATLAKRHGLTRLSMGMSGDRDVAAALGATHVRIGTALFGGR